MHRFEVPNDWNVISDLYKLKWLPILLISFSAAFLSQMIYKGLIPLLKKTRYKWTPIIIILRVFVHSINLLLMIISMGGNLWPILVIAIGWSLPSEIIRLYEFENREQQRRSEFLEQGSDGIACCQDD